MASASLRAYRTGPETLEDQRRIVREYLNSVPLAAQRGHGEVVGTADGLWAWYGTDLDEANHLLRAAMLGPEDTAARARVYRQALSLLVAHRRPTFYLATEEGRAALAELTDGHLRLLASNGVIPRRIADGALAAEIAVLPEAPARPPLSFVQRKAANQVRGRLLGLLGASSLYQLDRWDLTVATTLDHHWQER
jgi:membrane peptidoglycan carboxypeptidase